MAAELDRLVREAGARIIGALAAHFRDLDIAEEAFAEACARAAAAWQDGLPQRPDAWLYRTAQRAALDNLRKRAVRARHAPELPEPPPNSEDMMLDDSNLIPDERLRLIFVCCHPAVAPDTRAALTLRLVCGLSTAEIARSFLLPEPTLAQRLVRAKRKIAEAGVPFEIPGPQLWTERLDAVLSTIEVAYSKAHEDAAAAGPHAGFGPEMLELVRLLAELAPDEADVLALAALVHFAEARRPARIDGEGCMVPLAEQDPGCWDGELIRRGDEYLRRGFALRPSSLRLLRAGIHAAWCARRSLDQPPPWRKVLALYDALLQLRDDDITRLNRIVALAQVRRPEAALAEFQFLDPSRFEAFLPYHAVRADLLGRCGRTAEALEAYDHALKLAPSPAETKWLRRQRNLIAG